MKESKVVFSQILIISFSVSFFVCAFIPLNAYINNVHEFPLLNLTTLFSIAGATLLCLTTVLVVILSLLRLLSIRAYVFSCAIVVGLCIAAYIQGNMIKLDCGVLDGHAIQWKEMVFGTTISSVVWIGMLLICCYFSLFKVAWVKNLLHKVAIVFFAYCGLILALRMIGFEGCARPIRFSQRDFMRASSERNIVVFMLDTLDRPLFKQLLKEHPEVKKWLSGFTYLENTIGKYPTTKGALPQLLTGISTDNKTPYADYKDYAYGHSEILHCARKNNLKVRYYVAPVFAPTSRIGDTLSVFDNVIGENQDIKTMINSVLDVLDSIPFIYAPHVFKEAFLKFSFPRCVVREDEQLAIGIYNEKRFSSEIDKVSVSTDRLYSFYCMVGVHPPEYSVEKGLFCFGYIHRYMAELERLGVMRNTRVVILADHGFVEKEKPVFLYYDGTQNMQFKVSDTPFSYDQVRDVLMDLIEGRQVKITPCVGNRSFNFYAWGVGDFGAAYLPKFFVKEYDQYGNEVCDGVGEAKERYLPEDFPSLQMSNIAIDGDYPNVWLWTLGTNSEIKIPIPKSLVHRDICVTIKTEALLNERKKSQQLILSVGSSVVGSVKYDYLRCRRCNANIYVPAALNTNVILQVEFKVRDPVTPDFWNPPLPGTRPLGIRIDGFDLSSAESNYEFMFSEANLKECDLLSGFSYAEQSGRWNAEKQAELLLRVPGALAGKNANVVLSVSPFIFGSKVTKQRVAVRTCGKLLYQGELTESQKTNLAFQVDSKLITGGKLKLTIDMPDTVSPSAVGCNKDPRKLAIFFRSCKIEPAK